MEFKVKFFKRLYGDCRDDINKYIIEIPGEEIGLEGIDFVREKVGEKINLKEIHGEARPLIKTNFLIVPVSEEFAQRHYGLFENKSTVRVELEPSNRLNHLCYRKVAKDNGIYYIYYKFDEKDILAAWENAGCPKKWKVGESRKVGI